MEFHAYTRSNLLKGRFESCRIGSDLGCCLVASRLFRKLFWFFNASPVHTEGIIHSAADPQFHTAAEQSRFSIIRVKNVDPKTKKRETFSWNQL